MIGSRVARHLWSFLAVAIVAGPVLGLPSAVRAAEPTFGKPTIDAEFGKVVELTQPTTLDEPVRRVELLLTTADGTPPLVIEVPPPTGIGAQTLRHTVDVGGDGHILPNTPIAARWRLTPRAADAPPVTGPEARTVYADGRFPWRTVSGKIVRVHWYEGDDAFGARALKIAEEAIEETGDLLGVTEESPVDFFIYADQTSFYNALGPGTQENVGGQANAGIRTLFALITPADINDAWVGVVIPHELVHLVFDTAVRNPYHFPPRWLNEGLAVYQSQGYDASDRSGVEAAARDGSIIPLDGLVGQFPTTRDGFFLAYAESASAIDYLVRTYDKDALVALIGSYAEGRTDDEAFKTALGVDTAAFGDAWLADLRADRPAKRGPQPAPAGPRPSSWSVGSARPPAATTAPTSGPGSASSTDGTSARGDGGPLILIVIVAMLLAAGALVIARTRGRRGPPMSPPAR